MSIKIICKNIRAIPKVTNHADKPIAEHFFFLTWHKQFKTEIHSIKQRNRIWVTVKVASVFQKRDVMLQKLNERLIKTSL